MAALGDTMSLENCEPERRKLPTIGPVGPRNARERTHFYNRYGKRTLDILVVVVCIPIVFPVILISALIIWLDGSNPFYTQKRIGYGNKVFRIWKLRSMVPGADDILRELLESDPSANMEWTTSQKLRSDPRITGFGRFIRKYSIDELPQIWNVLKGDMSIVGPRPMMPEQRSLYPGKSYYNFRPGITGLWQITERNESSFFARSEYDKAYAQSVSAKLDVAIILSTVRVVVQGTGC